MKIFKYVAFTALGLSLAGFVWLGWFLAATPASGFDTQGPGLLGAFVMFGSQVLGVAGIVLLDLLPNNFRLDGQACAPL